MPQVLQFPCEKERLYATLSPKERDFADRLLRVAPDFCYELSGLSKLDPTPAPGVQSAVAAAKVMGASIVVWR